MYSLYLDLVLSVSWWHGAGFPSAHAHCLSVCLPRGASPLLLLQASSCVLCQPLPPCAGSCCFPSNCTCYVVFVQSFWICKMWVFCVVKDSEKLLALLRIASAGASVSLHVESVLFLCLARSVSPSYPNEEQDDQNTTECLSWCLPHLGYLPPAVAKWTCKCVCVIVIFLRHLGRRTLSDLFCRWLWEYQFLLISNRSVDDMENLEACCCIGREDRGGVWGKVWGREGGARGAVGGEWGVETIETVVSSIHRSLILTVFTSRFYFLFLFFFGLSNYDLSFRHLCPILHTV